MSVVEGEPVDAELARAQTFLEGLGERADSNEIAKDLIDHWVSIPAEQPIVLALHRGDVDHLYFCLQSLSTSLVAFQLSMVAWTNGQTDVAAAYYQGCIVANSHTSSRLAKFMGAVMERADADNGE